MKNNRLPMRYGEYHIWRHLLANKKSVCLLLLGLLFVSVKAQTNHQWGIQVGWNQSTILDEHSSPLVYRANTLNLESFYQRESNVLLEVRLKLRVGTNQAKEFGQRTAIIEDTPDIYGTIPTYEAEVNPWLSMVDGELSGKMMWRLGKYHQLGASINVRHIMTGIGVDDWYYSQADLSPEYRFSYPLGNTILTAELSLPVVAAIVRPTFAKDVSLPDVINYWWGFASTNTKVTSLNQIFNPQATIGASFALPNGDRWGIQYTAEWLSYPEPRPLQVLEQGVSISYLF